MSIITFAHRGAPPSREEENALPAFQRALSLGARGLESDIGLTCDRVPVLVHNGLWPRKRRIADLWLSGAGVDAVNLFHHFCTPRSVAWVHEQGVRCFAWGLRDK